MPTEKPRFTITVSDELNKAIEDYQHRTKSKNKTQAVSKLMEIGLQSIIGEQKQKSPAPESTEEERFTVDDMKFLLNYLGYGDNIEDISDKDYAFLSGIFDLLEAWFG